MIIYLLIIMFFVLLLNKQENFSNIIEDKTAINPTNIIDSYKVDTGGLCIIIILIIIADPCSSNPKEINNKEILLKSLELNIHINPNIKKNLYKI